MASAEYIHEAMKQAVVHVGFHKAASTYLQGMWKQSSLFDLIVEEAWDVNRQVAQHVQKGDGRFKGTLGLDYTRFREKPLVISNEGFHGQMQFDDADGRRVHRYQEVSADFLAGICPQARIVIITRGPEKWLMSLYNYYVKVGNSLKLSEYLERWGRSMLECIDVGRLHAIYSERFGSENVLVLPVEMLRDRKMRFFAILKCFAGLDFFEPHMRENFYSNQALAWEDVQRMRIVNKYIDRTFENVAGDYSGYRAEVRGNVRKFLGTFFENPTPKNKRFTELVFGECKNPRELPSNRLEIPESWLAAAYEKLAPVLTMEHFEGYGNFYRAQ